jgi:hypothetical protein
MTVGADEGTAERSVDRSENQAIRAVVVKSVPYEAIRRELALILASPAFRNSRRYSGLLTYLIERTLEGRGGELKERNIGVDVFGRQPDSDMTSDHSVRSAAGEIRKRLAQYYLERGHEAEIRIDLLPGSYVPQFRLTREEPRQSADVDLPVVPGGRTAAPSPRPPLLRRWPIWLAVFSAAAVLAISVSQFASRRSETALDSFWDPVLLQPGPLMLCIGTYAAAPPAHVISRNGGPVGVVLEDALALARIIGAVRTLGKDYRIARLPSTTFDDFRQGSSVLIGAFNNEWSLRLTAGLRFRFDKQGPGPNSGIEDSQDPSKAAWHPVPSDQPGEFNRDYAIVARCWNPETGRMVVVAAGVHPWGTAAAGDFLTVPDNLKKLEALAPKKWKSKNVEAVLSTDIIKGVAGPPNVVAAYFW